MSQGKSTKGYETRRQQNHSHPDFQRGLQEAITVRTREIGDDGFPRSSWWADVKTREEFSAAVAKETPRMVTSRFGKASGALAQAPQAPEERRSRKDGYAL